jgi:hypothetical protein
MTNGTMSHLQQSVNTAPVRYCQRHCSVGSVPSGQPGSATPGLTACGTHKPSLRLLYARRHQPMLLGVGWTRVESRYLERSGR